VNDGKIRKIQAEAAELMADECHDLIVELLICEQDWDTISDRVKDYMHDWAATFRAGRTDRISYKVDVPDNGVAT
jgi:hypothetical protein